VISDLLICDLTLSDTGCERGFTKGLEMHQGLFSYAWRHSRREQLVVLALILLSLPVYWMSLDLPRQIVNDAIQGKAFANGVTSVSVLEVGFRWPAFLGGEELRFFDGFEMTRLEFLFFLSCSFLFFSLVNGGFKYHINIRKGIIGERLLRRLRFELFERVMRFSPEDLRATKSAEVASMIKDEVEPIGGFFGDAFVTSGFLVVQATTALAFIMVQNLIMGLLAGAIIGVQGFVIPKLRREQQRLGRLRQLESRKLAGRVSEMVDAAPMLRTHNAEAFHGAEIGERLGLLYKIREALYRRKFAVKYLNNLLAQVTPFFFYTLGGYLALKGQMDIGQLVAVIAAYRDLPTPIKELIDWDQQRADATIKFDQVQAAFSRFLPMDGGDAGAFPVPADAHIRIAALRHTDRRGALLLDRLTLTLERPSRIAVVNLSGSGAGTFAMVLGGQITEYSGAVSVGDPLGGGFAPAKRGIVYLGSDPLIMSGSIRDNISIVAKTAPLVPQGSEHRDAVENVREAVLTGNPIHRANDAWIDCMRLGISGPEQIDQAIVEALSIVRGFEGIYEAGLRGPMGEIGDSDLQARILSARAIFRERLAQADSKALVETFEVDRFNSTATIGENLLFGAPVGARFSTENLASDPFLNAMIEVEALAQPMVNIGLRLSETVLDVIAEGTPNRAIADRYSFLDFSDPESLQEPCRDIRKNGFGRARNETRRRLVEIALNYIEPKHRLGLIDYAFRARVLRARKSFRQYISKRGHEDIRFYDREALITRMSLLENLLFGRVAYGVPGAQEKMQRLAREVIAECGIDSLVIGLGLMREAGPGGRLLSPEQRATVALARTVLARPDMLILDQATTLLGRQEEEKVLAALLKHFEGRTIVVTRPREASLEGFDRALFFDGASLVEDRILAGQKPKVSDVS
jgi:putative ABC transport system ATP-binding protein